MPFTFSHPAIIFPLKCSFGRYLSLTGLITGSLAPDFEKFLKMEAESFYSHSWGGVFWFNLPMGILLALLFHAVIRNPLIENLPEHLRKRLYRFKVVVFGEIFKKNYGKVLISIFIGAISHIIWDNITHSPDTLIRISRFIGLTHETTDLILNYFRYFDDTSSLLGILSIYLIILFLDKDKIASANYVSKLKFWSILFLSAASILFTRVWLGYTKIEFFELVFAGIASCLWGLLFSCIIFRRNNFI
ncbi:DUF4184 family protein [Cyclobacterium roseum]|uniref:DUF4184 family protein n=1 Tax=Cyclobacterium roseum TaxID=2666137 RepID=UPI001390F70E|nr:DUF4184 family protein [Cyclobacterium roseum]